MKKLWFCLVIALLPLCLGTERTVSSPAEKAPERHRSPIDVAVLPDGRQALTADGRYLAAASARSVQVRCWDTKTGKQLWERTLAQAFNLHGLTFRPDGKELVTAHMYDRQHPLNKSNIEQGWAINARLGRLT